MNIIVCMKQVPASSNVKVDPENGTLIRNGIDTKTNPYDLYALETALRIKEYFAGARDGMAKLANVAENAKEIMEKAAKHSYTKTEEELAKEVKVTVLTMGPDQAKAMIYDAYAMGADDGLILSDRKFAGSDVLATSYTLSQGIKLIENADLIICGKQTTDGDTAQIGPAIAEHLNIPHAAWVSEIIDIDTREIELRQDLGTLTQVSKMEFPCLITVDKDINVPRLPSYRLKRETKEKEVKICSFDDLPDKDLTRFGLFGSPTSVERMFPPEGKGSQVVLEGDSHKKAEALVDMIIQKKILEV